MDRPAARAVSRKAVRRFKNFRYATRAGDVTTDAIVSAEQLREAVTMVDRRAITEASGRSTLETVAAVAAAGVDLISVGWLTHSARTLDLGLDIERR